MSIEQESLIVMKKFITSLVSGCIGASLLLSSPTVAAQSTEFLVGSSSIQPGQSGENRGNSKNETDASIAKIGEDTDVEATVKSVLEYVDKTPDGTTVFNRERAVKDGATDFALAVGDQFNKVSTSRALEARNPDGAVLLGLPIYGNWCGPRHSGPGAPISTLDRLCQTHDRCYASRGYLACSCDNALKAGIRREWHNFRGWRERAAAGGILAYFSVAPCR